MTDLTYRLMGMAVETVRAQVDPTQATASWVEPYRYGQPVALAAVTDLGALCLTVAWCRDCLIADHLLVTSPLSGVDGGPGVLALSLSRSRIEFTFAKRCDYEHGRLVPTKHLLDGEQARVASRTMSALEQVWLGTALDAAKHSGMTERCRWDRDDEAAWALQDGIAVECLPFVFEGAERADSPGAHLRAASGSERSRLLTERFPSLPVLTYHGA